MTWTSAIVTLSTIAAVVVGLVAVQRFFATPFVLEGHIVAASVIDTSNDVNPGAGCAWAIDVVLTNPNERRMTVVAAELVGVEGSRRGVIASIESLGSIDRTYRYPLSDCEIDPASLGATGLKFVYMSHASTTERTETLGFPDGVFSTGVAPAS